MKKEELHVDGYYKEDIVGLSAFYQDKNIGTVTSIMKSKAHDILVITDGEKRNLIPYIPKFILKIDLEKKIININVVEGLLNEN